LIYYRESESLIRDACGMITYKVGNKHKDNLPLLLFVGWEVNFHLTVVKNLKNHYLEFKSNKSLGFLDSTKSPACFFLGKHCKKQMVCFYWQ
jgi:hypothetical protein